MFPWANPYPFQKTKGYQDALKEGEEIIKRRKEPKMTREEAIKIMDSSPSFSGVAWIARFEALGLIKFDEPAFYQRASWKGGNDKVDFQLGELEDGTYVLKSHGNVVWKS
jgi:hypothetical protein